MSGLKPMRRLSTLLLLASVAAMAPGCAAVTFPVTGIPVYRLPPELRAPATEHFRTINLALLQREQNEEYRIAPGDVLGVWVENVFGNQDSVPPVRFSERSDDFPASVGIPFTVLHSGEVDLPEVGLVDVDGMTLAEALIAIRKAYFEDKQVVQPGFSNVFVSLVQPRQIPVLVFRQESGTVLGVQRNPFQPIEQNRFKRGTGTLVHLPAYENDVLNALVLSGGLPGLDTLNEIRIHRKRFVDDESAAAVKSQYEAGVMPEDLDVEEIVIPLRHPPGSPPPFRPEDVTLQEGDVVFIESRDGDVFYTGGLLPTAELSLPQNYDIDVLEAIALARGPLMSGGLQPGNFAFNAELLNGDIGGPSPSLLIVLRKAPDGRQVPIRVDLNRALHDPNERILIQANDVLLLQQTPDESFARYVAGAVQFRFFFRLFESSDALGTVDLMVP